MTTPYALSATDTANIQAGGRSWVEKVGDALTKGTGGALVSGWSALYNTGVDGYNYFGGHAERMDTARTLTEFDTRWGQYYKENAQVIDTVGFIGGSIIPGGLAVKGLNAYRRGTAAGAFGRALNYTAVRQQFYLDRALADLATEGGTVFTRLNKNKLASMGWGVADNVLQTAAFEIAAASAMKASPLLDEQSWSDISWDIVKTSLAGGVLGGGIEALFTNRIYKDATKLIDSKQRKYDTFSTLKDMGLQYGDEAFSAMDSLFKLPKEVLENDKLLKFTYRLNGATRETTLDTSNLLDKALQRTVRSAMQEFEGTLTRSMGGDVTTGQPFARAMLKLVQEGKAAGKSDNDIRERLGDYLFNLKSVAPIGDNATTFEREVVFLNPKASIKDGIGKAFSTARTPGGDKSYRIVGDMGAMKLAALGIDADTQKAAWDAGFDMVLKTDGTLAVNPASRIIRPTPDPITGPINAFFNTKTGAVTPEVVPTIADIATKEAPLVIGSKVAAGNRQFQFSTNTFADPSDSVEATARHLWASTLQTIGGKVSARDISVLERLRINPEAAAPDLVLVLDDVGTEISWSELYRQSNFDNWLMNRKLLMLQDELEKGTPNVRELAYRLNVEQKWVEDAIAAEFNPTTHTFTNGAPDLMQGAFRSLDEYAERENVILRYNHVEDSGGGFVTGLQAYHTRVKLAQEQTKNASKAVLGDDFDLLLDVDSATLSGLADRRGSGASLFGFANADYGDTLRMWAQDTGKNVHLIAQRRTNAALTAIQPQLAAIKNEPRAAAELAAVVNRLRRSPEKYVLAPEDYGFPAGYVLDREIFKLRTTDPQAFAAIKEQALSGTQGNLKAFRVENPLVIDFLKQHMALNARRLDEKKVLYNAQGVTTNYDANTLYVPPVDTRKFPYFAFVRPKEGKIFGTSDVSMITARSDAELLKLAEQVGPDFDVIFKKDTERYFKAKGDYDYQRSINEPTINSELARQGKLGDFAPSLTPEDILEDFVQWHQRQETQLVRDAVSTRYAQTIAELQHLSAEYTKASTSKAEHISKLMGRTIADPFDDYIKTALDVSKRSEFTLLHQANEFVDALGTRAYRAVEGAFLDARKGEMDWNEANALMERYGLGRPYKDAESFFSAQTAADRNLIKTALNKANMLLATVTLRFDWAHSLVNIISTPIMLGTELSAIRRSIEKDPELVGALAELTTTKIPGQAAAVPSMSKLISRGVKNFFSGERNALLDRYQRIGAVKDVLSQYHEMVDDLSILPGLTPSKYAAKVDRWVERSADFFGNNFSEQLTRFVTADVMRQLTEPIVKKGSMSVQEQNAFMSIFVNRVQGNYIASQRPIAFQGTLGGAVGLFQTYAFNLFQQLFRHIENRDLKTVATLGALQTTVFGLNGLPLFEAVNTHLIGNASINDGHRDVYSFATQAAGKEMGDWLMYGTASAFPLFGDKGPALYTRGDLNPRHITVIPVSPLDVPAVDGSIRFVSNLLDTGKKLVAGADLSSALLEGLEHNGVSRPLAGIAQAIQGYSTTSKGSLISASNDFFSVTNAARIAGAKPMDEAVALNTKFRLEAYKAADRDRLEKLGEVVKTKLRKGQQLSEEEHLDFMASYAASGGRVENYSAAIQRWSRDANESVVNQLAEKHRTPYGQRMIEVMGGERLEDFNGAIAGTNQ